MEETLFREHPEVVDADLADYFGSIPHAELMRSLARRIVDSRVLHLLKMWLECAVEDTDDKGRKTRTTEAKDSGRGISQASPVLPLLALATLSRASRPLLPGDAELRHADRGDAISPPDPQRHKHHRHNGVWKKFLIERAGRADQSGSGTRGSAPRESA